MEPKRRWQLRTLPLSKWDPESRAHGIRAPWPPEIGDRVRWPSVTGALEWTVKDVDLDRRKAVVVGELLSRKQEHTLPIDHLEPIHLEIRSARTFNSAELYFAPAPELDERPRPRRLEPAPPDERPLIERVVDSLIFSEACLKQYQREFARSTKWRQVPGQLRCELRRGRVIRRNPREYLRIRTKRFDVILPRRPSDAEPFMVDQLHVIGRKKKYPAKKSRRRRR